MNRQEKRDLVKNLRKRGATKEQAISFMERITSNTNNPRYAFEGEKVKLDVARLMSYKEWDFSFSENYKKWVLAHKDDVFTVEYDEYRKQKNTKDLNSIVQLAEDETQPKWLFWSGDLIRIISQENIDIVEREVEKRKQKEQELQNKIDNLTFEAYNRDYHKNDKVEIKKAENLYNGYKDDI